VIQRPLIFISAVSRELQDVRQAAANTLLTSPMPNGLNFRSSRKRTEIVWKENRFTMWFTARQGLKTIFCDCATILQA
jgi:hypothetical protein